MEHMWCTLVVVLEILNSNRPSQWVEYKRLYIFIETLISHSNYAIFFFSCNVFANLSAIGASFTLTKYVSNPVPSLLGAGTKTILFPCLTYSNPGTKYEF